MTQWKIMGTTAVIALLAGNAALADMTPEEVWKNWQEMSTSYGQTVTVGSEAREGDTLMLKDVKLAMEQDGTKVDVTLGEMAFKDQGDGSVAVTLSPDIPMVIETQEGGKPNKVQIGVSQQDMKIIASGSAEDVRYDYTAPSVKMSVTEVNGVDAAAMNLNVLFALNNMVGSTIVKGATDKVSTGSMSSDSMDFDVSFKDPETKGDFAMKGKMAGLAGNSTTNTPAGVDFANMANALNAGFATDAAFTYGATDYTFNFTEEGMTTSGSGKATSGKINVVMDKDRLGYTVGSDGVEVSFSGPQIPFPEVVVKYDTSTFDFLLPVSKSDEPKDFKFVTTLVGLTISDDVWGMFDPGKILPRDPMNLVIDTKGTATMTTDIMDTKAMESADAPGQLNSLDINEVKLTMAGAELTGSGALTFDNTDLTSYDGMPAPTGSVNMKIVGANGLMDKLVQMGLLPEDQVMSARMMIGMFAKVEEGVEDTLTSNSGVQGQGLFRQWHAAEVRPLVTKWKAVQPNVLGGFLANLGHEYDT